MVAGSGAIQNIVWIPDVGVAVCSNRSKVRRLGPVHASRRGAQRHIYVLCHLLLVQDVLVVNCSKEFMASHHVLATCRTALKKQGVVGLNMAPCMRAFLERLPVMLQEQYAYEKVRRDFTSLLRTLKTTIRICSGPPLLFRTRSSCSAASVLMFPPLFQPHVVCGEQLVHSPYMQCLASLAVGLHLDHLLCRPPVPPPLRHCPPESGTAVWCASEWAWLDCFSTTVKAAEALARGATFPESFSVPDLEPVPRDEMALLMVREAAGTLTALLRLQVITVSALFPGQQ